MRSSRRAGRTFLRNHRSRPARPLSLGVRPVLNPSMRSGGPVRIRLNMPYVQIMLCGTGMSLPLQIPTTFHKPEASL